MLSLALPTNVGIRSHRCEPRDNHQLESTLETFIDVCPQLQRHRELYNLAIEAEIFVQMLSLPSLQFCYPLSGRTQTGVLT